MFYNESGHMANFIYKCWHHPSYSYINFNIRIQTQAFKQKINIRVYT